jgi:hypothetical protein
LHGESRLAFTAPTHSRSSFLASSPSPKRFLIPITLFALSLRELLSSSAPFKFLSSSHSFGLLSPSYLFELLSSSYPWMPPLLLCVCLCIACHLRHPRAPHLGLYPVWIHLCFTHSLHLATAWVEEFMITALRGDRNLARRRRCPLTHVYRDRPCVLCVLCIAHVRHSETKRNL